jgi:hypothetical protein
MLANQFQVLEPGCSFEEIWARSARTNILARNQNLPPSTFANFLQFQMRYCWNCGSLAFDEMAADFLDE